MANQRMIGDDKCSKNELENMKKVTKMYGSFKIFYYICLCT